MVRYADDFVMLRRSPEEADAALAVVRRRTSQTGLLLHPVKTRLVDARVDGLDFLVPHAGGSSPIRLRRQAAFPSWST